MLVNVKEFTKVIAEPQLHPDLARRFVAFKHEPGEQRRWTMLDGEGLREAKVVLGNYVRVDQGHRILPEETHHRAMKRGLSAS